MTSLPTGSEQPLSRRRAEPMISRSNLVISPNKRNINRVILLAEITQELTRIPLHHLRNRWSVALVQGGPCASGSMIRQSAILFFFGFD